MRADLSLTRLRWTGQLAVLVVFAISATTAFWYWVDLPTQARLAAEATELAELRQQIGTSNADLPRLVELRRQVSTLQTATNLPRRTTARALSAAELLRVLHDQAVETGLYVKAFRPKAGKVRDGTPELAITLEFEGTYHDFGAFLDGVSRLPQPISISRVLLRAQDPPAFDGTIDITCVISNFAVTPHALDISSGLLTPALASSSPYNGDGRRDPFISPAARAPVVVVPTVSRPRPEGLAGLTVEEVAVKGIVRTGDTWAAVIGPANGRTYFIRPGDRLMNGSVLTVTRSGIVFVQDADPAAARPVQREVRKELRPEAK